MNNGTILTLTAAVQGLLKAREAGIGIAGHCKAIEEANTQVLLGIAADLKADEQAKEAAKNRTKLIRMDDVDQQIFGGAGKLPSGDPLITNNTIELPSGIPAYLIVDCDSDGSGDFRVGLVWENDKGEARDMRVTFGFEEDAVAFANLYLEGRVSFRMFESLATTIGTF